jgi:gas vesicle protein
MRAILALLTGLGAGAAVMYLFDPKDGNRRRAMIRDQATKINRQTREAIEGHTKDISNRAKGVVHQLKSSMKTSESNSTDAGWSNGPAL